MRNIKRWAFTLVELLVVITILAIISVVAYQNFGWAVDKAVSGRKIQDVSTIETSLQQYKVDNNYYPAVDPYDATTNMWGYNSWSTANKSNTLVVAKTGEEIDSITSASGWGQVLWINAWADGDWSSKQIGAKGTISQATLWKRFLTKDLSDPEISDIKNWSAKLIDSGIGRYVYGVYKKPLISDTTWWATNKKWSYYNIAYTIKENGSDKYITKIVWDYDSESCFDESSLCPDSLIGTWATVLTDKAPNTSSDTNNSDQGIPYPVIWF